MNIRRLDINDYDLGYLDILTYVGTINKEKWIERFNEIQSIFFIEIWVIHDTNMNKIIASGTILIEPKFIHECRKVGHIEDIVTSKELNRKGLGKTIINVLTNRALEHKCYKVILDCSDNNIGFYEKCGFTLKGKEMVLYNKL